ncbi:hypothetical protein [Lignipirellula cremea]|uniref:Uncharacterized protein n=1 Tax=Lignipirellula cremea TaxID=2528010 RepID=A0A518E3G5_9BACT|nr:hypothetical protein [Lignipirellula cremea]QDU98624.1 hypothetical protein Pla8534_64950 [Lignipirellula cremea]
MTPLTAPGLPPWPPLLVDPTRGVALVSARHATWRSFEWAAKTTEFCVWVTCCGIAIVILTYFPHPIPLVRAFGLLIIGGIAFPIVSALVRHNVWGPLARQLFCIRTVVEFHPEAIVIRSPLYDQPVVVWRSWNGQPVQTRFMVEPDHAATAAAENANPKRKYSKEHLRGGLMLFVVVSTQNQMSEGGIFRAIPITEISTTLAAKFTMVCTAAATLTRLDRQSEQARTTRGVDIDADHV